MQTIYYKKLFEVRILHEYYLSKDNTSPYFALTDAEKTVTLENMLFHNQYDIWQDLTIAPTAACRKLLENYHIKLIPRKAGFFAGIRVVPDGADFVPFAPQSQYLEFSFMLQLLNPYFKNFTNLRLNPVIPALPYFTNANPGNSKTFPSLSEPVAAFKNNTHYAMGELARIGNDIREAIVSTNSNVNANWRKIYTPGISSESDRLLLPLQFRYTFDKNKNVKKASFHLKQNGNILKTIAAADPQRIDSVLLDFSTDIATPPQETGNGFFELEVSGDSGYQDKRNAYLNRELYDTGTFGAIVISNNPSASAFSIFTPAGKIKVPHPVFEIRLKSRITYWRYKSEQGKSFAVTPKTSPYLSPENGALRSIRPLSMLYNPVEFRDENPAIPRVFLPNPAGNSLRMESNGLVYSDIYLSKIKDLIIEV